MQLFRESRLRLLVRWGILLLVTCIGLSATAWVTRALLSSAQIQLEQRFQQVLASQEAKTRGNKTR